MSMSYEQIESTMTAGGQPFEIETIEIDGIPTRNWKNAPRNMADIVRQSAAHGDADFIVFGDERLTFREHFEHVAALANRLVDEFGIRKGDRVAIAMRNYPEWSSAFWAIAAAGGVVVPMNAWWTSDELAYGLGDSGAKLVFVDSERLERLQGVRSSLDKLERVVAVRCDYLPEDIIDYGPLVDSAGAVQDLPRVDISPDDDATLFYTSGTTGFPKGTQASQRNFCSVPMSVGYYGVQTVLRSGGTLEDLQQMREIKQAALLSVPLFHVTGCLGALLNMLVGGGKLVMMYKWDPIEALDLIEREKITTFSGVPTMVRQLIDIPGLEQRDLSSILSVAYGGAPAAPDILRQIRSKLPNSNATNGWGITETSSGICMIAGEDYIAKPESVGRPLPVCEVKVVDSDGNELPSGELGELWVRGPNVVRGYWNKPEATAESFTDGWFHTGDVGKIDSEGYVYIVDRIKDMIIRGGENVYCAEVEAAFMDHPAVKNACVFGTPHEILGEEVAVVVELRPAEIIDEDALLGFVAGRIAKFKIPVRLWLHTEPLPVGATGKVQKKELKEYYVAQLKD